VNDDYQEIGRQFGVFVRQADRFHTCLRAASGMNLEKAAYALLGRIVIDGPARLSALAEVMGLDLSTISRQVAALESAGLVARSQDSHDRRASVISATETGADVFARNKAIWQAALHELLDDWTPTERSEFARLFARLNESLAARAGGGMRQETTV
jgi:DNA-binding MarR family transcriptional regulator